ncbi:PH domain-containing protein [Virgibacillus xinjiangensis]|uniref:PH domain-containing protein n=1 Tax=Virgibacillus xinjiangensis TaxID=393090 RepID=A0ABV7CR34_9BACI
MYSMCKENVMYFPSKKDHWLTALMWGIAVIGVATPLIRGYLSGAIFVLPFSLLLLWFWFRTGYIIQNNLLIIRYGPIRLKVNIDQIIEIRKVKSIFAAPALSRHRLEIYSGRYNIVSVSPNQEKEFIDELIRQNPDLEIRKK